MAGKIRPATKAPTMPTTMLPTRPKPKPLTITPASQPAMGVSNAGRLGECELDSPPSDEACLFDDFGAMILDCVPMEVALPMAVGQIERAVTLPGKIQRVRQRRQLGQLWQLRQLGQNWRFWRQHAPMVFKSSVGSQSMKTIGRE